MFQSIMETILIKKGFVLAVLMEISLFIFLYSFEPEINEVFRYAARYSGRLSLVMYLLCFFLYKEASLKNKSLDITKKALGIFATMHVIHFIFLAFSMYLNEVPIIPTRMAGGFIAYLMVVVYPFYINKINRKVYHLIYFYYVGFVMLMTYISRIRGQFVGANPEIFHFIAMGVLILCLVFFGIKLVDFKKRSLK